MRNVSFSAAPRGRRFRPMVTCVLLFAALALLSLPAAGQSFDPHPVFGPNAQTKVYPGWDAQDLLPPSAAQLPAGFSAHVGGMAFLPNGKLAIADFPTPESSPWKGSVWLLAGVQTGDRNQVKMTQFTSGLYGPTGLAVAQGELYVIDCNSLRKLTDKDSNGVAEVTEITHSWHQNGGQPAVADLAYQNGYFYSAIGSSGGVSVDGASIAGGTAKIGLDGKVQQISTGYRNTGGGGVDSKGNIWATDNQGEWLPSSKLINVVPGRYYGFGGPRNGVVTYPPALWIPEGVVSPPNGNSSTYGVGMSPSTVLPIDTGLFAGQMLMGDIRYGNVDRIFLEKIGGEYQGALFHFSGGFRAGIYRMTWGPDGALYLGGLGGNFYTWSWKDNSLDDDWGLVRCKPNGKSVFQMLAVKARAGGFELQFTEPVKASVTAANFKVQTWHYQSTSNYGGPQLDETSLAVQSLRMSSDRTAIFLDIPGLQADHEVHIELDSNAVVSDQGAKPWTFEAWYTLNKLGTDPPLRLDASTPRYAQRLWARMATGGTIEIRSDKAGTYAVRDASGKALEQGEAEAGAILRSRRAYAPGLYFVTLPGAITAKVAALDRR